MNEMFCSFLIMNRYCFSGKSYFFKEIWSIYWFNSDFQNKVYNNRF